MPIQHRIGEKKRYHYGGGASGRYSSSSSIGRNPGQTALSGERDRGHSQESGNGTPNSSSGDGSPAHITGSRHSRYDPNANVSGRSSMSSRPGSRFNPNVTISDTVPTLVKRAGLNDNASNNNGSSGSRWAGSHSRYNPQISNNMQLSSGANVPLLGNGQLIPATAPVSGVNSTHFYPSGSGAGSNPYSSYVTGKSQRPRSSFDTFPSNDNIHGMNVNGSANNTNNNLSNITYKNSKPSSAKSSKNITSSVSGSRGSYWGSRNVRTGKYHSNSRYNGFKKYSSDYGPHDMTDIPKSKKSFETSHSLGSSLINSVPQTTKKVEEQLHYDHKRIDISADEYTGDSDAKSYTSVQDKHDRHDYGSELEDDSEIASNNNLKELAENHDKSFTLLTKKNYDQQVSEGQPVVAISPVDKELPESDHKKPQVKEEEEAIEKVTLTEQPTVEEKEDIDEDLDEDMAEEMSTIQESTGPLAEKNHIPNRDILPHPEPYPEPLVPIEKCIFPMLEPEMKLWLLKNKPREERVKNQKYLLKKPIEYLFDYPFFAQAWIIHDQAVKPIITKNLTKIKRYEYLRNLQLKDQFFKLQDIWEKKCDQMTELSESFHRSEPSGEQNKYENLQANVENANEAFEQRPTSSRRRNRADFVDDNDIENVLLQIDPDYKHHQLAANIPAMTLNPVDKFACKFKDVNNLVTDKDAWASRLLTDRIDSFTPYEHELFVEGYLTYPKKFGKVSHYMGGLRTPEECVLHYYRTKKKSKYKKLLLEKHKKRKASIGRRKKDKFDIKKKDSEDKVETEVPLPSTSNVETPVSQTSVSETPVEQSVRTVEQVVPEVDHPPPAEVHPVSTLEQPPTLEQEPKSTEEPPTLAKKVEPSLATFQEQPVINIEAKKESDTETENEATTDGDYNIKQQVMDSSVNVSEPVYMVQEQVLLSNKPYEDIVPMLADMTSKSVINESVKNADHADIGFDNTESHLKPEDEVSSKHSLYDQSNVNSADQPMKKKLKQTEAVHKSSYWSVQEAKKFPELLREFGSNWTSISQKLGTKSTTMVKNYFQRKAEQNGWYALVEMGNNQLASSSVLSSGDQSTKPVAIAPAPNVSSAIIVNSLPSPATVNKPAEKPSIEPLPLQTIPQQQKPAVGFFNDSKLSSIHKPSFSLTGNEDSFSRLPTPTQGLPPQHSPVITSFSVPHTLPRLNTNKLPEIQPSISNAYSNLGKPQTPSVHFSANASETHHAPVQSHTITSSRRSSIRSLLNDGEDSETKTNTILNTSPTVVASPIGPSNLPILRPMRNASVSPPSIPPSKGSDSVVSKVIVQELSHNVPTKQSNDLSKPMALAPTLPPAPSNPPPTVQAVPQSINFANDPLAALAAVASSSEAFGLMPTTNTSNLNQQSPHQTQINSSTYNQQRQ